jgi:carbamate kinase
MGNGIHGDLSSLNQALGQAGQTGIKQTGIGNKSSYYNEGKYKSGGMIPKLDILKGHGQKE